MGNERKSSNHIEVGGEQFAFRPALGGLGGALISAGPFEFLWEFLQWLETGVWPDLTVLDGLSFVGEWYPSSDWGGVQQIYDWVLACDLSLFMTIAGFLVGLLLIAVVWE